MILSHFGDKCQYVETYGPNATDIVKVLTSHHKIVNKLYMGCSENTETNTRRHVVGIRTGEARDRNLEIKNSQCKTACSTAAIPHTTAGPQDVTLL